MRQSYCISVLLWSVVGLFAADSRVQETQHLELDGANIEIPVGEHVIAHVVSQLGDLNGIPATKLISLLARNADGLIKTYTFRIPGISSASERLEPVCHGYAADLPPGLYVKTGEIPFRVVRSSCVNGSDFRAVVTLSFDPTDPLQNINYNIYVFRDEKVTFYKPQAGTQLEQFVFRDVDGDCLPEMVDVNRSQKIVVVKVRVVKQDGSVEEVQELSGDRADIGCGDSIKIDERNVEPGISAQCFKTRSIQFWDSQQRRFVGRQKPADRR